MTPSLPISKTDVWQKDFTSNHSPDKEELITFLTHKKVSLKAWHNQVESEIGLIITGNAANLEEIISFLNLSAENKRNRIILINLQSKSFTTSETLKLFSYGVEYVYHFNSIKNNLEPVAEKIERWRCVDSILLSPLVASRIAGHSKELKVLLRGIIEVAMYSTAPIIISGERGTGKELIARLIHELDTRAQKDKLVVVDCTTIKKELSGSELFGHEKGAFTGADNGREGAFGLAHNGTLFLDEIGELPPLLQSEFLRTLQEGTYKKLGSNVWRYTNFRLVAATNRDLKLETANGNFRKDLFDRISVHACSMPSLNSRKEDIPELIDFLLRQQFNGTLPLIDKAVYEYLMARNYEGNIRELKNIITRMILRYTGKGLLTLGDIDFIDRPEISETPEQWYEMPVFVDCIKKAIQDGYVMKNIDDTVKNVTMKIALSLLGKNSRVSEVLGVSDRWVQQRRAKDITNGKSS